jgi:hypothetical protein
MIRLTTEQLMERVSRDVEKMSPEQKAEVRRILDKAFPTKKEGK